MWLKSQASNMIRMQCLCVQRNMNAFALPHPTPNGYFFGTYIALERVTSQSAARARSHDALCSEVMAQSVLSSDAKKCS